MRRWSRRDVLKSSLAAPAAGLRPATGVAAMAQSGRTQPVADAPGQRERLLMDFGAGFPFGHSHAAAKDFGFGAGRSGGFQKTGGFLAPSAVAYDDSAWKPVDL